MEKLNACKAHDIKNDTDDFQLFDNIYSIIHQANSCLLLRQFEECLDICQKYIAIAGNYTENERLAEPYLTYKCCPINKDLNEAMKVETNTRPRLQGCN